MHVVSTEVSLSSCVLTVITHFMQIQQSSTFVICPASPDLFSSQFFSPFYCYELLSNPTPKTNLTECLQTRSQVAHRTDILQYFVEST